MNPDIKVAAQFSTNNELIILVKEVIETRKQKKEEDNKSEEIKTPTPLLTASIASYY